MQNKLFIYTAPFIWMGVIFILSSLSTLPSPPEPLLNIIVKKSAHLIEYAILAIFWYRFFHLNSKTNKNSGWLALLVSGLYAVTDEYHQLWVPGRHPSGVDILIDWLGVCLGLWWIIHKQKVKNLRISRRNLKLTD